MNSIRINICPDFARKICFTRQDDCLRGESGILLISCEHGGEGRADLVGIIGCAAMTHRIDGADHPAGCASLGRLPAVEHVAVMREQSGEARVPRRLRRGGRERLE